VFRTLVDTQSPQRIPAAQAEQWIADAKRIAGLLGC
jgi:hypothetical protein